MHIVLLGMHLKIVQILGDGIFVVGDIHLVVDDVARMGDPLPAYHELVFGVVPEGVGQSAVPAGKSHAAFDRFQQLFFTFRYSLSSS